MTIAPTTTTQLAELRETAQEVMTSLARQQDILRLRQITFQPGLLGVIQALAPSIERAERSLEADERELVQLRVLAETSALVNSSLDVDTVFERALDAVLQLTGAGRGYLFLRDGSDEPAMHVARKQEEPSPDAPDDDNHSVSRTILREVIRTGKALLTNNAVDDPRITKSATITKYSLRSVLCVPLTLKGVVEGAIYVDNRFREGVFTERELALLTAFSNQIAVAIENSRLFASVQASLRDIGGATELMQNVFTSIASGVITTDARDSITTFNLAAADILNQPPDTPFGQPLRAVLPMLGAEFEEALLDAQTQNTSTTLEAETEIEGRGRIALKLKVSPLKNREGQTEGVAMVLDDLTAQRERDQTIDLLRRYLPPGMVESIREIAQLGIGGERREVSCMFIDVGAFTSFGALQPAHMMDMLNVYLEAITNVVHLAGGLIDKYMGSEVMVLFNTQLNPQNDHAARAAETALTIGETLRKLPVQPEAPAYRIGIHTGVATLGNVGGIQRRSFTALGDSINLAKRLQENAASGQIIISEATLEAIRTVAPNLVRASELSPLQVKGRQQTTRVFEVARP